MTPRRGSVRREVVIDRPPAEVWELIGAADRLFEWFPGIVSSPVEGSVRTITTGAGLPLPEQILTNDPLLRRFQYRITSPIVTEHCSTIDVHRLGDAESLVVYSVDAEPSTLALIIGGAAGNALLELKRLLEGSSPAASDGAPAGDAPHEGAR